MNPDQKDQLRMILIIFDKLLESKQLTEAEDVQIYEARQRVFYAIGGGILRK